MDPHTGPDPDLLVDTFLRAPLPNLPCRRRLFQREDLDVSVANASHQQFIDRYHNVTSAIQAGFGPGTALSPSGWVRATSDLIECILHGVRATRAAAPPNSTFDPEEFQKLLRQEDWETIQHMQTNIDHLAKVFPTSSLVPPLICHHCAHCTDPDADVLLSEADYQSFLMAADRSRDAVLGRALEAMTANIDRDVKAWAQDETAKRKNALRVDLRVDAENFYVARVATMQKEMEKCAAADCEDYHGKRLIELTKDADAQIKQEIAAYRERKRNALLSLRSVEVQAKAGPVSPPETHPALPQSGTSVPLRDPDPSFDLKSVLADVVERLKRLENPPAQPPVPATRPSRPPACETAPRAHPVTPAEAPTRPAQETSWAQVARRNKDQAPVKKQAPAKPVPPSQNPATLRTEVTVQRKTADGGPHHQARDRRNPADITRQVCAALNTAKSPLVLLSGRWVTYTDNFVFTFAGSTPYSRILEASEIILQPFPEAALIPCSGWSRVTFNGVPTSDPEGRGPYSEAQLLEELARNPICADLMIVLPPRWVRAVELFTSPHSSISFAFHDPDGEITRMMAHAPLAMFGRAVTFKKWLARPPLRQCPRCHKLGHLPPRCPLLKDAVRCYICGDNHTASDHPLKCKAAGTHAVPGVCDCLVKCINCNQDGHSAKATFCKARDAFKVPAHNATLPTPLL
jgi:hypothetical protein